MTLTAPEPTITRPQSWRIELPTGLFLLNDNQRLHFRTKAKHIDTIRNASCLTARAARIPHLQRAHIYYVIHPKPGLRRRDPGNWSPSAKAAIDGLVDAGLLPDDDSTRLLGPDPRLGSPIAGSQLVLVVTDLDQMTPAHIALLNPPGAPK
ncbi:hypothetical protein [Streptomyces lydicus]|uniref:hypothetical protein n=1 Tax=Streptomyces lydicus TaxID=47763 RepID=UPI0037ACAB28